MAYNGNEYDLFASPHRQIANKLYAVLLTFKKREIMPEIRWTNGKEEYDREEIAYMLQTQRAMILNDMKYLLIRQAERKGLKGKFTDEGLEIIDSFPKVRKVVF